jgi:hypothetical protein
MVRSAEYSKIWSIPLPLLFSDAGIKPWVKERTSSIFQVRLEVG